MPAHDLFLPIRTSPVRLPFTAPARRWLMAAVTCAVAAGALAGCGAKSSGDKAASQTAAKVNKEEITVHQINFVLQQQRNLAPEQAASASRQVLQRLIDQEVTLQKAQEQRVDRDPRVVQEIEAARREVIARAYLEKVASGAPRPTDADVQAYFDAHPALFQNRRIYTLQEIAIEAPQAQLPDLRSHLQDAKNVADFVEYLKDKGYKYAVNQATRPAEQLPLASLDTLARLKDGESLFNATPTGAQVVVVVASSQQPVGIERAKPAIEQFIFAERRRKLMEDDVKALRAAAKIELVGDFAKPLPPASPPVPASSEPDFAATRGSTAAPGADATMSTSGAVESTATPTASRMESVETPTSRPLEPTAAPSAPR